MSSNPLNVPLPAQAKAVLAGVIAGLTTLLPLMPDGFQWSDLVATLIAGLIGYGAVFGMPNTPPPGGAQRSTTQPTVPTSTTRPGTQAATATSTPAPSSAARPTPTRTCKGGR